MSFRYLFMKKYIWFWLSFGLLVLSSCRTSGYRLAWQENFGGNAVDTSRWEKIPRGRSHWNKYMSAHESLYAVKGGRLILRGTVNNVEKADTARYLTGGVRTKRGFGLGKMVVKAKLGEAIGAWPAFWMLPMKGKWPLGGEIDIMEHLNHDTIAYQTIHTHYTYDLKKYKVPPHGSTGKIRNHRYNTYAVEIFKDSLVFSINGRKTFAYPRLPGLESEGQYPFVDEPFYLMLDMQLGGMWVGKVDPATLPCEMRIDWVKFYRRKAEPRP